MSTVVTPTPLVLAAARTTGVVPAVVGVPEITPVVALRERPGGRPIVWLPVGAWLAEIDRENGWPTVAATLPLFEMTGELDGFGTPA
jgi:hypothetical protein